MIEPTAPRRLRDLLAPYRNSVIAEATGVTPNTVSAWITGRGLPAATSLAALATFLKMDVGELTLIVADEKREAARG